MADYFETAVKSASDIKPSKIANAIKNKKYDWTKIKPEELVAKIKSETSDQISDETELTKIIDQVLADNPKIVEQYKSGKVAVIGFLIGQVMQASRGKANPQLSKQLIEQKLS